MNLESKIKQIVLDKSSVIEFVTWQDDVGESNFAYLLMDGKDVPKYQSAIKSGNLTLEDWGVFYKGKGDKPSDTDINFIKDFFGEEVLRIKSGEK